MTAGEVLGRAVWGRRNRRWTPWEKGKVVDAKVTEERVLTAKLAEGLGKKVDGVAMEERGQAMEVGYVKEEERKVVTRKVDMEEMEVAPILGRRSRSRGRRRAKPYTWVTVTLADCRVTRRSSAQRLIR